LGHVVGMNTARKVWECLEAKYLQATKERELQLKRQLQTPKKDTASLDLYLRNLSLYVTALLPYKSLSLMKTRPSNYLTALAPSMIYLLQQCFPSHLSLLSINL
jgi:hypothetical protein